MCTTGPGFTSPAGALAAVRDGLEYLNSVDTAGLPAAVQADCLRGLARAEAAHTAAQARILGAFSSGGGYEQDGQGSARVWLRWQARITRGAAAAATGWMRRLAAHPAVGHALAGGGLSPSWAREICRWSDELPAGRRPAPMTSCWPPRPAARTWLAWPPWPRRSAAAAPGRMRTGTTGLMTGTCGWMSPSAGPGG